MTTLLQYIVFQVKNVELHVSSSHIHGLLSTYIFNANDFLAKQSQMGFSKVSLPKGFLSMKVGDFPATSTDMVPGKHLPRPGN